MAVGGAVPAQMVPGGLVLYAVLCDAFALLPHSPLFCAAVDTTAPQVWIVYILVAVTVLLLLAVVFKPRAGESVWCIGGQTSYGMPRNMVVYSLKHGTVSVEDDAGPGTPRRSLRVKKRAATKAVRERGVTPLLIHSCIALNDKGMEQLEEIGTPTVLVVPNAYHRSDAALYKQRFPELEVLCPAAALEKVSEVVEVNGVCEDRLAHYDVRFHAIPGNNMELMYQLPLSNAHPSEGYVFVVTDALFNMKSGGVIAHILGSVGPLGVTRIGRWFLGSENKQKFADWLREISDDIYWTGIIVAHGEIIRGTDSGDALRAAADRLCPQ